MPRTNNNSTSHENDIKQKLAEFIKEGVELIETAHDEGRLIYPSYLFNLENIENKTLKENVRKHWQDIIKEYKEKACLADLQFGYTDSTYFEHSKEVFLFEEFYTDFKEVSGTRKCTYILKDEKKPSDALFDILFHSKMIIDCQASIGIAMYYAFYRLMKEIVVPDGKEKFDSLFSEQVSKMIISRFNLIVGTRNYCVSGANSLAPLNPMSYFLEEFSFQSKTQLEVGTYVCFRNTGHYPQKHPFGNGQSAAAFCVEVKPELTFYSLGMGKTAKTENEIRQIFLDAYNEPVPAWYNDVFKNSIYENYLNQPYSSKKLTMQDIPGLKKEDVFFKFDIEKLKTLLQFIAENKFPKYLDYLKKYLSCERQIVAFHRLKISYQAQQLELILKQKNSKVSQQKINEIPSLKTPSGFWGKIYKACPVGKIDTEESKSLRMMRLAKK